LIPTLDPLKPSQATIQAGVMRGMYTGEERGQLEGNLRAKREAAAEMALTLKWAAMFVDFASNASGEPEEDF